MTLDQANEIIKQAYKDHKILDHPVWSELVKK